jgi:hypothetical protein
MRLMLKIILILSSYQSFSQYKDRNIQISLHTAGRIINISPIASPTGEQMNLTSITFQPRLGYSIKGRYNFGIMGMYGFAHSTAGDAPDVWGMGYYLKYSFMPKEDTAKKFRRFIPFVLFEHLAGYGYYAHGGTFKPVKIDKTVHYLGFQGGVDIRFKKGFSLGLTGGFGTANFYKDDDVNQGTRLQVLPYSLVIFQYNFKI